MAQFDDIRALYAKYAGRAPDAEGLEYWSNLPMSAADREAKFKTDAADWKPYTDAASNFYRAYYGGEGDPAGVTYAARMLRANGPEYTRQQFMQSKEGDFASPGAQAVRGINRMPGVFSDYGSLGTMPKDDVWKMFYSGSAMPKKEQNPLTAGGSSDPVSDANSAFIKLLDGMTEQQRDNFLSYVLDISNKQP